MYFGSVPIANSITDRKIRAAQLVLQRSRAVDEIRRTLKIEAICDEIAAKRERFIEIRLIREKLQDQQWLKTWTAREIIERVAYKHGLAVAEMLSTSRCHAYVHPRQEAYYQIARLFPKLSFARIGKAMGGRDHTTVMHGIRAHRDRYGLPPVRGGVE